ncbi:MAG: rRNA maturation RNase YbeY [Candidatus Cyclobacteriaceae bacterium M2_1C_046]
MAVNFFIETANFRLTHRTRLKNWIKKVIAEHKYSPGDINYIFADDEYLLKINQQYLNHDYYTDIITFDQSEEENTISGDIYLSVERIRENSFQQKADFVEELKRVMVHGILHLLGYNDQTPEEKEGMRKKEEACISLYQ